MSEEVRESDIQYKKCQEKVKERKNKQTKQTGEASVTDACVIERSRLGNRLDTDTSCYDMISYRQIQKTLLISNRSCMYDVR